MIFFAIACAVLATMICFSIMMLVRNEWVYRQRARLIDEDYDAYRRLVPYGDMMLAFWVWNIEDFKQ